MLDRRTFKTPQVMEDLRAFGHRNLQTTGIPVVGVLVGLVDLNDKERAMNPKAKRSILGIISSLLLTAGFANAAERLDPVSSVVKLHDGGDSALRASDDCGYTCNFAEDVTETKL